jgi:Uma2 family endonuclease
MVEVKFGLKTVDVPFTIRLYGVTEEMFDELVDEDTKAELLDGIMIVHSPASPRHDNVAGFLRTLMRCYAEMRGAGLVLGPDSLVHLASCRRFGPDVFFFREERVPMPLPEDKFEGPPDLVAEILSPSNREDDLEDKRPAYQEAGVAEIWFVDPDQQEVIVDHKRRRRYAVESVTQGRITSAVLDGFWVDVSWLWSEPLPNVMDCLRAILDGR